jgi:sugar phosphate permease
LAWPVIPVGFIRFRQSEVKAMNLLLAVVALILTVVSFLMYQRSADNKLWLAGFILFLIVTLVFGGLFLSGRVNKGEDIHITE